MFFTFPQNCPSDGSDVHASIQAALDLGGDVALPEGNVTYTVSKPLIIGGNTRFHMRGSKIKATSDFNPSECLLVNRNISTGTVGLTIDNNIEIRNGCFEGSFTQDVSNSAIAFIRCGNLLLEDVSVRNWPYIGIQLGSCKKVRAIRLAVSGTGKRAVTVEGGPAIWIGSVVSNEKCTDVLLDAPDISNCEWAGIYATNSNVVQIRNPYIRYVKEAGIFGTVQALSCIGGRIENISKKYISGSGMEFGGFDIKVDGTVIRDTANCAISLTDAQLVDIKGILSVNARRDPASFPQGSHVSIVSLSANPSQPRYITVSACTGIDLSSASFSGVQVSGAGVGAAGQDIQLLGNDYSGTSWASGVALNINPAYWNSANCTHKNNAGAYD